MASTPESAVKKLVKEVLDKYGAYYFSPVTGGYGKSGVPDIIACFKGHFIGIECKAGRGVPTALQYREMRRIQAAGGHAMVINENTIGVISELFEFINTGKWQPSRIDVIGQNGNEGLHYE